MKYSGLIIILLLAIGQLPSRADAQIYRVSNSEEYNKCSKYFTKYEKKYLLPAKILKAVAMQESGLWHKEYQKKVPWPWTINANGKGYYFKSKKEALKKISSYKKRGIKSIDVGCMQINMKYHGQHFSNINQAFDPEYNVRYSASLLRKLYDRYGSWKLAVANYHTGSNSSEERKIRGRKYSGKVLKYWRSEIQEMIARNKIEFDRNRAEFPVAVRKPAIESSAKAVSLVQNFKPVGKPQDSNSAL